MFGNFLKKITGNYDLEKKNQEQQQVIDQLKKKIETQEIEADKKSKEIDAKKKGQEGETLIKKNIHDFLDQEKFYSLHDLTLSIEGTTTQIDHVVVSEKGIFVIETKNIRGWIFGSKYQKKWTVSLGKNKKFSIQNPLHQNYKHTETIKELLPNTDPENIISVVVFVSNCDFKKELPDNVIKLEQLASFIESSSKKMNTEQMYYAIGALEHLKEKKDNIDEIHLENLKNRHKNKKIA